MAEPKIFVAGHRGLVGSAIVRALGRSGFRHVVTRSREELDLTRQAQVERFLKDEQPDWVFLAAAKVGGIVANQTAPADFIGQNLLIEAITIEAAYRAGVKRLMFLGSSCIHPKYAPQPLREEHLLTGALEPTNEAYAVAKLAGLKMCEYYRRQHGFAALSVMPTNLYGPGDNFDLHTSHVLPALIRKFHEAKMARHSTVTLWGSGTPKREFLFVDDLADACVFLMQRTDADIDTVAPDWILNVGYGEDLTIRDVAEVVRCTVDVGVGIEFDSTKPDGTPRKVMDSHRVRALGWRPKVDLADGVRRTYAWYLENVAREHAT